MPELPSGTEKPATLSTGNSISVLALATLLSGFTSGSARVTVASAANQPRLAGTTLKETLAWASPVIVPRLQMTSSPDLWQLPWLATAEPKLELPGM